MSEIGRICARVCPMARNMVVVAIVRSLESPPDVETLRSWVAMFSADRAMDSCEALLSGRSRPDAVRACPSKRGA
jgi:hypothetical protein